MHGLIREEKSFGPNPRAKDIARHLFTRMLCGKVVIVTEKPNIFLPTLRRQWLKLARKVLRERAKTVNVARINELVKLVAYMYNLRFTTKWPPDDHAADIYITTPEQAVQYASDCRTIYVVTHVDMKSLHIMTSWMQPGSLAVICRPMALRLPRKTKQELKIL